MKQSSLSTWIFILKVSKNLDTPWYPPNHPHVHWIASVLLFFGAKPSGSKKPRGAQTPISLALGGHGAMGPMHRRMTWEWPESLLLKPWPMKNGTWRFIWKICQMWLSYWSHGHRIPELSQMVMFKNHMGETGETVKYPWTGVGSLDVLVVGRITHIDHKNQLKFRMCKLT